MIERYTRPEMGRLWTAEHKFLCLMKVEIAVARAQGKLKIIPKEAAQVIEKNAKFDLAEIEEIEKVTKHDVIAFVTNLASHVGDAGRFVHYGLTSSDVLDSALSLQIQEASQELETNLNSLQKALEKLVKTHGETVCVGRTHGIHAEPTTFGLKMAGFLAEFKRNRDRFKVAFKEATRIKLSGAVGTYSALGLEVEKRVSQDLRLPFEEVATQVIPRDRHAHLIWALAMLSAGYERLAVEIRHLQRTEVGELEEGFQKGQKGSSAMPHKKNPIASENITGLARVVRGNLMAAMEDISLWHERDISHSSVERIIFPDSFILVDYMTSRLTDVLNQLVVKEDVMRRNLDLTQGQVFSSHVLLALIKTGMSREEAYKLVQSLSHGLQKGKHLKDVLLENSQIKKSLKKSEIDEIFQGKKHLSEVKKIINRVL